VPRVCCYINSSCSQIATTCLALIDERLRVCFGNILYHRLMENKTKPTSSTTQLTREKQARHLRSLHRLILELEGTKRDSINTINQPKPSCTWEGAWQGIRVHVLRTLFSKQDRLANAPRFLKSMIQPSRRAWRGILSKKVTHGALNMLIARASEFIYSGGCFRCVQKGIQQTLHP